MEGSAACLDTTILVDSLRGRRETVEFIRELEATGTHLLTTTINSFELYYGAYRSPKREKNLLATRSLLRRLTLLDLSEEASEEAARILAILEAKGEPIEFRDVLIAAISKVHKSVLITRDSKHFMRIPDLELQEAP